MLKRFPLLSAGGRELLSYCRVHNLGLMGDRFSNIPRGYIEPYTLYAPATLFAILLGVFACRFLHTTWTERSLFGLLLAGGFSNLWDHWRQGFVVDTLQVWTGFESFLPFNLADTGILVGSAAIVAILACELIEREPVRAAESSPGHPSS